MTGEEFKSNMKKTCSNWKRHQLDLRRMKNNSNLKVDKLDSKKLCVSGNPKISVLKQFQSNKIPLSTWTGEVDYGHSFPELRKLKEVSLV